ncbi:hypothetical protein G7046_g3408 [Stylonectria norvegica]|nr:hypothetical protein G7046_g3408 [Stylonectria norvegica]
MSLTARERHNPPSRRKSCAACIKAKRRCDFAVPACLRCSQRHIPCQYPARRPHVQELSSTPPQSDLMQGMFSDDTLSPATLVEQFDAATSNDFDTAVTTIEANFQDFVTLDYAVQAAELDLIRQATTLAPPASKGFDNVSDALAHAITNRLQWSVDEMQKAPSSFVLEMQTPWCHAQLYRDVMPRSIQGTRGNTLHLGLTKLSTQDAQACCALYMAKNRVNAPVIFRTIESRVQDLLSSPTPEGPRECLAHTQALVLYQIIRLFDGDIRARGHAERTIPALEASALTLLGHVDFENESLESVLPLFPLASTKAFWNNWILQESTRRTLLFTFYFLQAYRILNGHRGLSCDGRLGLIHSWTLSAHLWHADTPLAFSEAWRNKNHFVITDAYFNDVLEEAKADDIDTYGKIFISSFMGIEEAQGWFASRGGSL